MRALRLVWSGVAHAFPSRWPEWVMSAWIITWGLKLVLDPADNFAASHAWDLLHLLFRSDVVFGLAIIVIGMFRVGALAVNGTFANTLYSRYSPVVRGIAAAMCGLAWLAVALSASGAPTMGSVTYPFPFIIEVLVAWFIAGEAGLNLRAHRHAGSRHHPK